MSPTNSKPSNELSSTLPTNGEIYVAPAFDANIACATEKHSVTFTVNPSVDNNLHAFSPSTVNGTLIVTFCMSLKACACSTICMASSATTSADIDSKNGKSPDILLIVSTGSPPLLSISDGFVVTPSIRPD